MKYYKTAVIFLSTLLLAACQNKVPDVELKFVEQEKGVEPYQTRLIVTQEFMRFDDGEGSIDFILYDRRKNIIYSVNSGERTVMSVSAKQAEATPPFELKQSVKELGEMKDAPTIQGKTPQHYQFYTNDKLCYEVVIVKDLLPNVVAGMKAFHDLLATDSKLTFNTIPADMHDACNMSMSTFAPGRHFKYGFPVREWSPEGAGRSLVDFNENYEADPKLFELPNDYQHYSIQDFREGKVTINN